MASYYIRRVDKNHAVLHEEELTHPITRTEARMSLAWLKANKKNWVRGIEKHVWEEILAEMDKDEAGEVKHVQH